MEKYLKQPLFWGWIFLAIWLVHIAVTLFSGSWEGLTISLTGLLAVLLIMSAILSRRHKNLHHDPDEGVNH